VIRVEGSIVWWPKVAGFRERKAQRSEYYRRFVYGWVLCSCTACNGSGRYDHNGSPPCSACDGTGKERVRGIKAMNEWA
jgi:hypothetical protein